LLHWSAQLILQWSKAATTNGAFCIAGGPQESQLEDSFFILDLVSNPQNETVVKDVAADIKQFYYRDVSSSAAVFSDSADVRNNFLLCSDSTNFSISSTLCVLLCKKN
jgi:hypothetical protein